MQTNLIATVTMLYNANGYIADQSFATVDKKGWYKTRFGNFAKTNPRGQTWVQSAHKWVAGFLHFRLELPYIYSPLNLKIFFQFKTVY